MVGGRWSQLPDDLRDVLRIGAYQLEALTRVPHHAAVHTTVEIAKRRVGTKSARLVNAVLRNLLRRRNAAKAEPEDLAARHSHPRWLVDRWVRRFGPVQAEALLRHNNRRPPLVVQAVRTDSSELHARLEGAGCAVQRAAFGLGLVVDSPGDVGVRALPGYAQGHFIVQDPAQARLLGHAGLPDRCTVWDACAAPGGKAVCLSESRRVVASDWSSSRIRLLHDTVTRTRADVFLMRADARWPPLAPATVDAVLVDAPCSATGTIARHPDARWRLSVRRIGRQVERQREILDGVASVVRPGGCLAYLTCSLEPEENEEQVNAFLDRHPEYQRDVDDLTVFPPDAGTDGGFAARLRRAE